MSYAQPIAFVILFALPTAIFALGFFKFHWGVLLFLFLLPLVNISIPAVDLIRPFTDAPPAALLQKSVSYDKIALFALAALCLARGRAPWESGALRRNRPLLLLWGLYFAAMIAASAVPRENHSPLVSAWNFLEHVLVLLTFLIVLNLVQTERMWRLVFGAVMIGGALFALEAILQNGLMAWTGRIYPIYFDASQPENAGLAFDTYFGALRHPNFAASYILLLIPAVTRLFLDKSRWRFACLLLLVGQLVLLAISSSLGAYLSLPAAMLLMMWVARSRAPRSGFFRFSSRSILPAASIFLCFFLIAGAFWGLREIRGVPLRFRLHLYRVAANMVADRPLAGHGLGSFPSAFSRKEETMVSTVPSWRIVAMGHPESAHSSYVKDLVEMGLPGGAAFALLVWGAIIIGFRSVLRQENALLRRLGVALMAGATGFAIQAGTEELFSFPKVSLIFWTSIALSLALNRVKYSPAGLWGEGERPDLPGG